MTEIGAVALGAGAGMLGFLGKSIGAAANFEQAMDGVAASLGGVGTSGGITTAQFQKLQDEALRIGATTSVGANDAAQAMDLLAKAGIPVEDIYNGVAQAVVNVSEATGESLDQSASTVGSMQNLFRDTGISATQMADVLVNAMNSSDATMSELQTGIANMAPIIAGTGMDFGEAAGLIAYFNSQGMAAAKVGTSLTSAYTNLISPIEDMAKAQQAMGLAVYDTNGQFRGLPAILEDVRAYTQDMDEASRDAFLTQLFGANALDVVQLALKGDIGALEAFIASMNESGTAAAASATRMDNLRGDLENLGGAFETLMIRMGTLALPALRALTQAITKIVELFAGLPTPILAVMGALGATAGVILTAAGAWVLMGSRIMATIAQIRAFLPMLGLISLPILAIVAALAALGLAYKTNFSGFADAVDELVVRVKGAFTAVGAAIEILTGATGKGSWRRFEQGLSDLFGPRRAWEIRKWFQGVNTGVQEMRRTFDAFRAAGLNPVAAAFATLGNTLIRLGGGQGVIAGIGRVFGDVAQLATGLGNALSDVVDAFQDLVRGDFSGAVRELREAFDTARAAVGEFASSIWDELSAAVANINWGAVWSTFTTGLRSLASAGIELGTLAVNAVLSLGRNILDGAADLWGWVKRKLGVGALVGDGTGGPEPGYQVPLGDVLVSGALKLWGDLKTAASGLWDWVKGKLGVGGGVGGINMPNPFGGTSGNKIDLGDVLLDAQLKIEGLVTKVTDALNSVVDKAKSLLTTHRESIESAFKTLFDFDPATALGENLGARFGAWLNGLDWSGLFGMAMGIQSKIFVGVGAVVAGAFALLGGLTGQMASFFFGFLTGTIGAINWGGIKDAIGSRLSEAFQGASDRAMQALQSFADAVGRLLSRAGDAIKAALEPVKTAFDGIATAAGNAVALVKNFITDGIDKLAGIGEKVSGYLSPITEALDAISGAIDTVVEKWNSLPIVGGGGGNPDIPPPGARWFGTESPMGPASSNPLGITTLPNVGSGSTAGMDAAARAATQAAAIIETAAKAITGSVNSVAISVQASATSITGSLTNLGTAFATAQSFISTTMIAASTAVNTAMNLMHMAVSTSMVAMRTTITTTMTSIQTATITAMTATAVAVNVGTTAMSTALRTGMQSMLTSAVSTMTQFAVAVNTGFQAAVNAARSGVQGILGAVLSIGSLHGVGFGIGSSLGQGIAAGLLSQLNAVASASAALASAAAAGAQARGQISSPSRLMRDRVGIPLAQGLIAGFENQRGAVARSFASLIPTDTRFGRSGIGTSSAYSARGNGQAVVVHQHIYNVTPPELQKLMQDAKNGSRAYYQQQSRAREIALGTSR